MTDEQIAEIQLRLKNLEDGLAALRRAMLDPPEPKWDSVDHRFQEEEFVEDR